VSAPNQWELSAWRLVAQLALQGLPQWTGPACGKFCACVRDLWELHRHEESEVRVMHLEQWFVELRRTVPINKLAEYDRLMQLAIRFRDRCPPQGCPIGPSDEQIAALAMMVDRNGVKGGSDD